jgi:hypothetical protein
VKDFKEPDTQRVRTFRSSYGPQEINFVTSLPFMISEAYDVPPVQLVLEFAIDRGPAGCVWGWLRDSGKSGRLCGYLSSHVDRMVIDGTVLKGLYNFVLKKPEDAGDQPVVKSEGAIDQPSSTLLC